MNIKTITVILSINLVALLLVSCGADNQAGEASVPVSQTVADVEVKPTPVQQATKLELKSTSVPAEVAGASVSGSVTISPLVAVSPTVLPSATPTPVLPTLTPTYTPSVHSPTSVPAKTSPTATSIPTPSPTPEPTPTPVSTLTTSEANCTKKTTHIYCLSSEIPAPPQDSWVSSNYTSNENWAGISGYSPEVFCASDLSVHLCGLQTSSLLAAIMEWGNYSPVEYWVIGTEVSAMNDIIELNCDRRLKRGEWKSCGDRPAKEQADRFERLRNIGSEAVATGKERNEQGHNGFRNWGIHFYSASLPTGFTDLFDSPAAESQQTVFHEYFHAVQSAHLLTKDHYKRYRDVNYAGPVWFFEGAAEYMSVAAIVSSFESGLLKEEKREGQQSWDPLNSMEWKLRNAIDKKENVCPELGLKEITYDNNCRNLAYDLGTWAHAYLAHKFGPNVLLETFYPNNDALGWEGAFQLTYGMSSEEFYNEFGEFINWPKVTGKAKDKSLSLEDHLSILPVSFESNRVNESNSTQETKLIEQSAKQKLISIGYNVPVVGTVEEARQEYVASLDIPDKYRQRFIEIQENLNSVLGGYPNYIYFAYNRNGTEEDAKPVLDRMTELRPNQKWTISKLIERQSCLGGANPGGTRTSTTNPYSVCLENLAFIESPWGSPGQPSYYPYIKMALHLGHEYFHHYQRVHALDRGLDYQQDRNNPETTVQAPTWWIEGAAVAFQNAWYRENWQSLPGLVGLTLDEALDTNIATVADARVFKENRRNIMGYGDSEKCTPDWYMSSLDETYDTYTGCSATFMASAYLGYLTSYKTVWIDIPQDYYDLGFWGSFEKHVGMNKQEFYDSYNEFLRTGDPDDEPPDGWAPPENYISEYAKFLKIVPESD